jgi:hypothetical protein
LRHSSKVSGSGAASIALSKAGDVFSTSMSLSFTGLTASFTGLGFFGDFFGDFRGDVFSSSFCGFSGEFSFEGF